MGASPINSMKDVVAVSGVDKRWTNVGWLGVLAALLISFYVVIAGWALSYIFVVGSGHGGADGECR